MDKPTSSSLCPDTETQDCSYEVDSALKEQYELRHLSFLYLIKNYERKYLSESLPDIPSKFYQRYLKAYLKQSACLDKIHMLKDEILCIEERIDILDNKIRAEHFPNSTDMQTYHTAPLEPTAVYEIQCSQQDQYENLKSKQGEARSPTETRKQYRSH